MLLEDTEKIGVPNRRMLHSVNRRLPEMGTFHRIRWDSGCPRSVRNIGVEQQILEVVERQPVITARRASAHTDTSLAYTVHYNSSCCNPVTFSMWKTCIVNGCFKCRPNTLCLQQRFYSGTDCAPLGPESQTFKRTCVVGRKPQCDSISVTQLSIDLWSGISSDFSVRAGGYDYLNLFRAHCSGLLEDVSFNTLLRT
jgi:hypothetical protein